MRRPGAAEWICSVLGPRNGHVLAPAPAPRNGHDLGPAPGTDMSILRRVCWTYGPYVHWLVAGEGMPLCPVRTCPVLAPRMGHVLSSDRGADMSWHRPRNGHVHSSPCLVDIRALCPLVAGRRGHAALPGADMPRLSTGKGHGHWPTGSWDAFIGIRPLTIAGGTGSPANATAVT